MTKIKLLFVTLYTAAMVAVNPVFAEAPNKEALEALKQGDMRKLAIHTTPKEISGSPFLNEAGEEIDLSAFHGKTVLLNFWATWCAPCRAEMPGLDALNAELGGDAFEVVTVATGRNPPAMIDVFFDRENISNLPKFRDPKMTFSRSSGVLGLPVTVILNAQGQEVARLQGEADWNSMSAKNLLSALIIP